MVSSTSESQSREVTMMHTWRKIGVAAVALCLAAAGTAAETPRRGGTLDYAVDAEPPNYDCHANSSHAAIQPLAPHHATLLKFDTAAYPKIVPDLAQAYVVSVDQLSYRFTLRANAKFHDGTPVTAADVKASYERIRNPPPGVVSLRRAHFEDVAAIDTPDAHTVVFKLAKPDAAMLANFASPWNCIYPAAKLAADPNFPRTNVFGAGPFVFVEHVKGSHWVGKRFEQYHNAGQPYLDGFRIVFIRGAALMNALQGGQILAEFRGFAPPERDRLVQALGDKVTIQESGWACKLNILFNSGKAPFDDPRVRRALNLALDRWSGEQNLSRISFQKYAGGLLRPGAEYAASKDELARHPGFGTDIAAARAEARRLLKETGQENLRFALASRNIPMPYTSAGLFLLDSWRQIGVTVEHQQLETAPHQASLQGGTFDVAITSGCDFMDEPNLQLANYISKDKTGLNYGNYIDRTLDELYEAQKRATSPAERARLIRAFEARVLDQSYSVPILWWTRAVAHRSHLKGWHVTPSHYVGQDLAGVWLAPQ
jgi:peptide/nickel transport system substrate-binding protein